MASPGSRFARKAAMLFLVFQLGKDRYAIDAAEVVEVLPLVNVKNIPQALAGVAGVFDYHGVPVPLIDLTELALGKQSRKWMSTRIILVNYRVETGQTYLLGLLAERATETLRRTEEDFTDTGVAVADTSYLGAVTTDGVGIVQRIEVRNLLPETVRSQLFRERIGSA
jgi:chemotaxis-related protein WspB